MATKRGNLNVLVKRALYNFWGIGILSVLTDLDHIWARLGLKEPISFTGWINRPFHHPVIFAIYAICYGLFMVILQVKYGLYGKHITNFRVFLICTISALVGLMAHLKMDGMFLYLWGIDI